MLLCYTRKNLKFFLNQLHLVCSFSLKKKWTNQKKWTRHHSLKMWWPPTVFTPTSRFVTLFSEISDGAHKVGKHCRSTSRNFWLREAGQVQKQTFYDRGVGRSYHISFSHWASPPHYSLGTEAPGTDNLWFSKNTLLLVSNSLLRLQFKCKEGNYETASKKGDPIVNNRTQHLENVGFLAQTTRESELPVVRDNALLRLLRHSKLLSVNLLVDCLTLNNL